MSESEVSIFDDLLKALRVAKWARYAIILLCLCGAGLGGIILKNIWWMSDEHNNTRYYTLAMHVADEAHRNERISAAVKLNDDKFQDIGKKIDDVVKAQHDSSNSVNEKFNAILQSQNDTIKSVATMGGSFDATKTLVESINAMLINKHASTKAPERNPFDSTNR